jgi:DoxX-like family
MNRVLARNVEVDVAFWVVSFGMGLVIAAVGAMKLLVSKEQLALRGAGWVHTLSSGTVRFVGLTEVVGGLAIIVPPLMHVPASSARAAAMAGLLTVIVGAAAVHARRREPAMMVWNFALLAVAATAIWNRSR